MTYDLRAVSSAETEERTLAWRYAVAAGAVFALGVLVIVRMVMMQSGPERERFEAMAPDYYSESVSKPRGLIFDREGHLLAGDRAVYELDVNLKQTPEAALPRLAQSIGAVLRVDVAQLTQQLLLHKQRGTPAVQVSQQVSEEQKAAIEASVAAWADEVEGFVAHDTLGFYANMARYYPEGDLAANVLGYVAIKQNKGYGGVEQYYDNLLKGGVAWVQHPYSPWEEDDAARKMLSEPAALYLTIDRNLQHLAEKTAQEAAEGQEAKSASIIVADPYTGEILAMAVYPRPNLNDYAEIQEYVKKWDAFNLALERTYEPGSVFKIVTMAAAIDQGTVTPDTPFEDTGSYQVPGRVVYNWNRGAWGDQTMVSCLQHSLNTCLAWVAVERVGKNNFYNYLQAFGFGQRTGIDLGGEPAGFYNRPGSDQWSFSDFASQAFGQAIAVTPVQMVAAASAIANGGYLVTPHVLRYDVVDGRAYRYQPEASRQVISAEASRTMRKMLEESLQGESEVAMVPGYSVAGKTGTAEISAGTEGYVLSATNASFVGWFPAEKPQYLIYVWLEQPKGKWASIVAAPVFAQMVRQIAALEHVPPDAVREQLEARHSQVNP